MQVSVTNCTFDRFVNCTNMNSMECFEKEGCGNAYGESFATLGRGTSRWIKNPGTPRFQLQISVGDNYYTCTNCGNSASGSVGAGLAGISLQYNLH